MKHTRAKVGTVVAALSVAAFGETAVASGNVRLIRRNHPVRTVEVGEIGTRWLVYREGSSGWLRAPLSECVALLDPTPVLPAGGQGWLRLADGQRFPGEALSGAKVADDVLVWNQSSWIGRMEVPLDRIESVVFIPGAAVPAAGKADVLTLANGDRIEGFILALGDPVIIELINGGADGEGIVELPLSRVASARMVTPPTRPEGRRLWLTEGTIVDVDEILMGEDGYVRFGDMPMVSDQQLRSVEFSVVAAILFDPEGLVPFAALPPQSVTGPATRYVLPRPRVLDDLAPLGLARVEFRGPLSVRYELTPGAAFLSGEARLPIAARALGDCELVVRDDSTVIFSTRLNADHPSAAISAPLSGSALTIEITDGSFGPIQDFVVLHNALVLIDH